MFRGIKVLAVAALACVAISGTAVAGSHSAKKDLLDMAVAAGSFESLVIAVKAAGLVDTLKGAGPSTVFAPTDEAFAKLPAGTFESLLKPANRDRLVAILTYRVVPGRVMSGDIAGKNTSVKTVHGQA